MVLFVAISALEAMLQGSFSVQQAWHVMDKPFM